MSFNCEKAYQLLQPHFANRVRCQEPLAEHCAFAVGGPADLWVSLETSEELMKLVHLCAEQHWPLLLIGGGRNVLFADRGVRGIVAQIQTSQYTLEAQNDETALLTVEAGTHWSDLLKDISAQGWGGLEFGIGIPGTLGAGIISNAGAHNQSLGQLVESIDVLDARGCNWAGEGEFSAPILRQYLHQELDFGYRYSRFRTERTPRINTQGQFVLPTRNLIEPGEIVLRAVLRLHRLSPQLLTSQSAQYLQERRRYEPDYLHTGPVFQDAPTQMASELIARAGLQGKQEGQAQIMDRNANYIANLGGASASEIGRLIVEAYQRVYQQSGVPLTLNIDLQGEWNAEHDPA